METSWLARSFNIPAHPPASGVAAYKENATKVKLDMFWHIWGQGGGLFSRLQWVTESKDDLGEIAAILGFHPDSIQIMRKITWIQNVRMEAKLSKNDWRSKIRGKSKKRGDAHISLSPFAMKSVTEIFLPSTLTGFALLLQQNLLRSFKRASF